MAGKVVPGVERIAVLRANALGDFIFALPALDALDAAYPEAEIVLLGRPWHAEFLEGRPGPVDRVVVVPGGSHPDAGAGKPLGDAVWLAASADERVDFARRMRAERFDLAVQLHGGGRNSNPFLLELGARHTVGLRTPDAAPLDASVPYVYYQQEVARSLEVAALVGATPLTIEPRLALTERDVREAGEVIGDEEGFVVVHPGAVDPRRRWRADGFAAVADALVSDGWRVLATGTQEERRIVDAVTDAMQRPSTSLAGKTTLHALAGILGRARVVVANDTGVLHLAAALGVPTVGIYWCGNLVNGGPLTRARHRPVLGWTLHCAVCGIDCTRGRCTHEPSFVADAPVDEVLDAARSLLEDRSPSARRAA